MQHWRGVIIFYAKAVWVPKLISFADVAADRYHAKTTPLYDSCGKAGRGFLQWEKAR